VSNSHMGAAEARSTQPWSVSDDSLKRFVVHASETCIQDLLAASGEDSRDDGWKVLAIGGGVEISRRSNGPLDMLRGRRILRVPASHFKAVATAIDTAKQWDPNLAEGTYIKDLHENLSIIRLRFSESSKPLFKNREFIVLRETRDHGRRDLCGGRGISAKRNCQRIASQEPGEVRERAAYSIWMGYREHGAEEFLYGYLCCA
ncbi:hypothetical protein KI387_004163, partial [Taxus chinensis]